jgi:hypothetical protein
VDFDHNTPLYLIYCTLDYILQVKGRNRVLLGYAGRILITLRFNNRQNSIEKLDQETAKNYVGGIGLA